MGNFLKHLLLGPLGKAHHAFLMAARAKVTSLAGKSQEEFMRTVPTADAGKPVMEIATFQILFHYFLDDRPPEAKFFLVLFVIEADELFQVVFDHGIQGRSPRVDKL
jgi:hypothetical protein